MKRYLLILAALGLTDVGVRADAKSTIDAIERLPRAKRPAAYEQALAAANLDTQDRVELTRAFAKHAKDLSPAYTDGKFPFEEQRWIALLRKGFDAVPRDAEIAHALAQLLIDRGDHQAALPVAKAFRDAHTENHFAQAWLAWCEAQPAGRKREVLTFPVHFCVLTRHPDAHRAATAEQCRKECEILNKTFVTLKGESLARFEFKGFAGYSDVKDVRSELLAFGDRREEYDTELVVKAFNATKDKRARDPQAINFYIYDAYTPKGGAADTTSHGKRNSNRPFVLIDWQRLNNNIQNAEAHEMGHAFGLEHVGVVGATEKSSTNIMASAAERFGSGGRRDLGFTPAQAAVIHHHARRTHDRLRSGR